jgi:hypothetical protein
VRWQKRRTSSRCPAKKSTRTAVRIPVPLHAATMSSSALLVEIPITTASTSSVATNTQHSARLRSTECNPLATTTNTLLASIDIYRRMKSGRAETPPLQAANSSRQCATASSLPAVGHACGIQCRRRVGTIAWRATPFSGDFCTWGEIGKGVTGHEAL